MILLDTSVVSEPLRPAPDTRAIAWIDAQPLETIYLSAITVAELRAGVALLPADKRRSGLQQTSSSECCRFLGRACSAVRPSVHTSLRGADDQSQESGAGRRHRRWLHRCHRSCQRVHCGDPMLKSTVLAIKSTNCASRGTNFANTTSPKASSACA